MDFDKAPYPEHPSRCQTTNKQGQCPNLGVMLPDETRGKHCLAHGGGRIRDSARKANVRNYRLEKWQQRLEEKADSDVLKSLREEIGVLRICLEERLNKCNDAMDLILQSGPISDLVMKINVVVQSCHKLEGSMGNLLDKQAILQFAQVIIGIVGNVLTEHPTEVNIIADEIVMAVGRIGEA